MPNARDPLPDARMLRRAIELAFDAALRAADPAEAVRRAWADAPDGVTRLISFGKASAAMTRAAVEALGWGAHAAEPRGVVITIPEHAASLGAEVEPLGIEVHAADHPIPTDRNVRAAQRLAVFAGGIEPRAVERLLVLISGGGSAQLSLPAPGLTLDDLAQATRSLLRAGATINELNCVRKHAELLKGGGLARMLRGAPAHALVLSDVLGDPLDVISSGPMAPDPTTFADALAVLDRCGVRDRCPALANHLERGARGEVPETPKPGDECFARAHHRVIGSNALAIDAAARSLDAQGIRVVERRAGVEGDASDAAARLVAAARAARAHPGSGRLLAVVWGGETTVRVGDAPGLGGRNQELSLAAAIQIAGDRGIAVGALATDGRDGPTDAAGGIVDGASADRMRRAGADPRDALSRHDSTRALDAAGDTLRTGPTGTNVNDVMIAVVAG